MNNAELQAYKKHIEHKLNNTWNTQEYTFLSKQLYAVTQTLYRNYYSYNTIPLTCNSVLEK